MTLAVKWAMRYYHLEVDWFDSLDEAVGVAGYASDDGQEALDCIEVFEDDGSYRRLTDDEVFALYRQREREQRAAAPPPKPVVARLYVTHPDGQRVLWSTFTAESDIERWTTELAPLGDRVEVERVE